MHFHKKYIIHKIIPSVSSVPSGIASHKSHKSHKSQSSCRRSDYSETAISTHPPVSMASVSRSAAEVMAVSTEGGLTFASRYKFYIMHMLGVKI